jgi:tryptophan 2,3-dioxygenase
MSIKTDEPVTYWSYLKLAQLLDLQTGLEGEEAKVAADELHFIIVHQVFELWFKLIIKELYLVRDKMAAGRVEEDIIPFAVHHLQRVNTILGLAASHFDLMETLTPQDFLVFRSKLGNASGFQSFQLREIELLLGLKEAERKAFDHDNPIRYILEATRQSEAGKRFGSQLEKAQHGPSLHDVIQDWLYRTPIQGSAPGDPGDEETVNRFLHCYLAAMQSQDEERIKDRRNNGAGEDEQAFRLRLQSVTTQAERFLFAGDVNENEQKRVIRIRAGVLFIESYRELPLLSWPRLLLDTLVELEERFIGFRFRHARMVERIIGRRVGTGGSPGVDYLDTTTRYRIFKELWAVRTLLLPGDRLPDLEKPGLYGFSVGRA